MNTETVLARAAAIVAEIRHSHGIKCALAILHLQARFPHWGKDFWQQALVRSRWFEEPVVEQALTLPDKATTPERARVILERTVVPRAYGAVRAWAAARGADDIIRFYLEQASADPEYLGHRLSVLLALQEACPLYVNGAQRNLFLDRLTEFILACRFTARNRNAPPAAAASWEQACTAALRRPGFFGHHLICLAWIGRSRESLSESQLRAALAWVVDAAGTIYDDAEDNVELVLGPDAETTQASLEANLQDLLLRGERNIHLLTLADAVAWLWDKLDEDAKPYLIAIARHPIKTEAT